MYYESRMGIKTMTNMMNNYELDEVEETVHHPGSD
jgi:hypothetical protein